MTYPGGREWLFFVILLLSSLLLFMAAVWIGFISSTLLAVLGVCAAVPVLRRLFALQGERSQRDEVQSSDKEPL